MDFDYTTETITPDNSGTVTISGHLAITGSVLPSVAVSVTAAGTTQGTATLLPNATNIVSTATAGTATGVLLPSASAVAAGYECTITNKTTVTLNVYPPSGGTIDGQSANTPITLPPGGNITLASTSAAGATWVTKYGTLYAGTNVTLTQGPGGMTVASTGGGGGGSLITLDEGVNLTSATAQYNFTGAGMTATASGNNVTINVPDPDTFHLPMTFQKSTFAAGANSAAGMAYGNGVFVQVLRSNLGALSAISTDGLNWTTGVTSTPTNCTLYTVTFGNGRFIVTGVDSTSTAIVVILYSYDGLTWNRAPTPPAGLQLDSITFGNGMFAATPSSASALSQFYTSVDGINWTAYPLTVAPAYTIYARNKFWIMNSDGTVKTWTTDPTTLTSVGTSATFASAYRMAEKDGVFIATPSSSTATSLQYSLDFLTWTTITLPSYGVPYQIAVGNGVFVFPNRAGNAVLYSKDGITWVSATTGTGMVASCVAFANDMFVFGCAVSNNTFCTMTHVPPANYAPVNVGMITLTDTPNQPTPLERSVVLFGKSLAGRVLPASVGPSGLDACLQPSTWRQKIGLWSPPGNVTTAPGITGLGAFTAQGTATARAVATTNLLSRTRRIGYVSAATAGSFAGHYSTAIQFTTGDGAGLGGFFFSCRFAASDAVAVTSPRMFIGMQNSSAVPTNVEPNTIANCIGVAQLSTSSTQLYIVYGGSAAQTAIALGTNFPPMTAAGATNGVAYDFTCFAPPSKNGTIYWRVERIGTTFVAEGVITPGTPGTQTPLNSVMLAPRMWRCNNAALTAVGLDIINVYVETDY